MKIGDMLRHKDETGITAKIISIQPLILETYRFGFKGKTSEESLENYYPISDSRPSKVPLDFDVEVCYEELLQCADKVDQYGLRDTDACVRLGALVIDLHNWMRSGGAPPKVWNR